MIEPLGDSALVVRVGTGVSEATRQRVLAVTQAIAAARLPGAIELVPGFTTVTVHYDPTRFVAGGIASASPYDLLRDQVAAALAAADDVAPTPGKSVEIPVCYGGEFGPDLEHVAAHAGVPVADVIAIHAAPEYRVHIVGFLPGFPYLGGLDPRIATPRRDTPRTAVPAGSVGIGGAQTGVYPLASPGGWHLIGRTPAILFDPVRRPPTLLAPGDRVRFRPIDRDEFDRLVADSA